MLELEEHHVQNQKVAMTRMKKAHTKTMRTTCPYYKPLTSLHGNDKPRLNWHKQPWARRVARVFGKLGLFVGKNKIYSKADELYTVGQRRLRSR